MTQNGIITTSGLLPGFLTNSVLGPSLPDLYALDTPKYLQHPNTLCSHAFQLSLCLTDVGNYSAFKTLLKASLLCGAFSRLPTTGVKRSVFYAACIFVNPLTSECCASLRWPLASFSVSGTTLTSHP